MFGKKKNGNSLINGLSAELQEFLEDADKLYIRSFETRSIGILKEHFTRDCCLMISRWIVAEASSRYFCDAKYRTTTWSIIDETSEQLTIRKTCIYKDIKLNLVRSIKVSDDYTEEWKINVTPDEYWVADIKMVNS